MHGQDSLVPPTILWIESHLTAVWMANSFEQHNFYREISSMVFIRWPSKNSESRETTFSIESFLLFEFWLLITWELAPKLFHSPGDGKRDPPPKKNNRKIMRDNIKPPLLWYISTFNNGINYIQLAKHMAPNPPALLRTRTLLPSAFRICKACTRRGKFRAWKRKIGKTQAVEASNPKQSMGLVYLPACTIKINQMWGPYIPYMDDMGMFSG